ncbi:hypothetical protein SLEP1_g37957 [Rubroshorea leprosula]|uniref:Uncharacterized protein n=1 Tax=Rubroshorea leprosula TaxID=152421 RepID=A0AAV5KWE4_9ROSI|nr:hypothetical protein SLEP1_g37957 [Rubroshorea leprosula]
MQVTKCETREEIVVCLDDDVKDGIIFTKLEYLQLEGLPRLARFCSGVCNFEFPDLEVVIYYLEESGIGLVILKENSEVDFEVRVPSTPIIFTCLSCLML